jgi:pimeloyl-ACP methyl ester carboxylesterase
MNNWLDKSEYPFNPNYYQVGRHRLHYIDEGQGDILLFVHGTPSWSFEFRNIIKGLKDKYRCLAIDHIGFGLSDKPREYNYTTENHSKILEKFVNDKQLENITMVVHDFGGPIGLNYAIKNPENIINIIILNSWLWSNKFDPEFIKLSKKLKSPLLPFLYRYLNFSPRFILPKSFGHYKISRKILRQFTKPFADNTQRNGALAFAKSLLNDQDWFETLWENRQPIANKPTLLIWGMKDPFIKAHNLKKFQEGFANTTTFELSTCGHFPQEEQPEQVLQALKIWLNEKQNQHKTKPTNRRQH